MKRSGFTIVEVLITMVILTVLLTLGVVGLRTTQANGRDAERKADIEALAVGFEQRYNRGNAYNLSLYPKGGYPGSNELWAGPMYDRSFSFQEMLPGVSIAATTTPTGGTTKGICLLYGYNADCDKVEKNSVIAAQFTDGSGGWKDIYLYEFVGPDNKYCNSSTCVRYNLYWISETDKTVYKGIPGLKVRKSKHQ